MNAHQEPSRQERRRARTRQSLIDAARALLSKQGVDRLTIKELAERADLGAGTFYLHFSSKEDLIEAVVADSMRAVAAAAVAETADGDPAATIAIGCIRVVRIGFDDPDLARLLINLAHADALFGTSVSPFARPLIEEGVAAGRFSAVDIDVALTALVGATLAVIREAVEGQLAQGAETEFARMALALLGLDRDEAVRLTENARRKAAGSADRS